MWSSIVSHLQEKTFLLWSSRHTYCGSDMVFSSLHPDVIIVILIKWEIKTWSSNLVLYDASGDRLESTHLGMKVNHVWTEMYGKGAENKTFTRKEITCSKIWVRVYWGVYFKKPVQKGFFVCTIFFILLMCYCIVLLTRKDCAVFKRPCGPNASIWKRSGWFRL